jgi:V/A-type H+-transporting ATPase subunit I
MAQVEILLLQRDMTAVLRALARARIIHLHRMEVAGAEEEGGGRFGGDLSGRYAAFSGLLERIMAEMGIVGAPAKILFPGDFPQWEDWAVQLRQRLSRLRRRHEQMARMRVYLGLLSIFMRRLTGIEGDFSELRNLSFSLLRLGVVPTAALGELPLNVPGLTIYPLKQTGDNLLVAILSPRGGQADLDRRLAESGIVMIPLPAGMSGPFSAAPARLRTLRKHLRRRLRRLETKMAKLRWENETLVRDRLHTIEVESRLLRAGDELGYTRRTVAIGGWVPQRRLTELREILDGVCSGGVILRHARARGEETPVLFFNPALIRPFQRFLSILGTPTYGEVEPTPLLALGFLVLFGMMFGDVGHGLVLLAGGVVLRRYSRFRDAGLIVAEVGVFAALFGLLFGSIFGREDLFAPLWFSPFHDIPRLMLASLVLGVSLILIGLLLRILNGLRVERIRAVLTDRFGVAGLVFYAGGLATAVLVYRGDLPAASLLWLAAPLAAVFCHPFAEREAMRWTPTAMLLAEGGIEVLETVLGFLANTFSFLRVAAFGLAHVGLFMAVFALADQVRQVPLGPLWVALVHVAGNAVILVLEGLVVSIQAVRLEFYEIFSKFFRGTGVTYRPLALEPWRERRNGDAR